MSNNVKVKKNLKEPEADELNAKQSIAIGLLLMGKTQREAAQIMKISEETISRWKHGDPAFQAVLNQGKQDLFDAGLVDLLKLRRKAAQAIEEMLERGEWRKRLKAAELILKFTHGQRPEGETNAREIAIQNAQADKKREFDETFNF